MKMRRLISTLSTRTAVALGVVVLCPILSTWAAEPQSGEPAEEIPVVNAPDVLISATRTPTSMGSVNQAVTIVSEEQLRQQLAASPSRSITQIMTKLVPGLSQTDQSMDSGTSLKIRGRSIAILIDGVPQQSSPTTELDLAHIDPSAIERIEIIRALIICLLLQMGLGMFRKKNYVRKHAGLYLIISIGNAKPKP